MPFHIMLHAWDVMPFHVILHAWDVKMEILLCWNRGSEARWMNACKVTMAIA